MHCAATGQPWIPAFTGTGHVWPLLNGERDEQDLQTGDVSSAVRSWGRWLSSPAAWA